MDGTPIACPNLYDKLREQFLHVRRHRTVERQRGARNRVDEPEMRGMQRLTPEIQRPTDWLSERRVCK